MLNCSLNLSMLKQLKVNDFVQYVSHNGWSLIDHPNIRWRVYEKHLEDHESIQLVLPLHDDFSDAAMKMGEAISVLAIIENLSEQEVFTKIRKVRRDVLKARVIGVGEFVDSLSLTIAASNVWNLKNLIVYAASSERDPRPYFVRPLTAAVQHASACQFGHTFQGSFGFTIESPLEVPRQMSFEDMDAPPPFERRVVERILRGLVLTQRAVAEEDVSVLTEAYKRAFNANMCQSLVNLSKEKMMEVEFSVVWSPVWEPPEDLQNVDSVKLTYSSYIYLERAALDLQSVEPRKETILGKIILLRTRSDPREQDDKPRTVEIPWHDEEGRAITVRMSLEPDDYLKAVEAHKSNSSVTVTGMLERIGTRWRLEEPTNFNILGSLEDL